MERLLDLQWPVEVLATPPARIVWRQETEAQWAEDVRSWRERGTVVEHQPGNQAATIASGTYPVAGMVIVPCSMGTVAALAAGLATNLLLRAADVQQKEGRRLVVMPRETPLAPVHLQNLLTLAQRGIRIVPPMPNFYKRPRTVAEVVDFVASRALVALGVADELDDLQQWQGLELE
ncbi:MAG: UbiX family flavin prenyltransferase [Chloroflexota bacterium]|nr:UbiX family flavin prenyltransferase [Chloroflexota bacterium]